MESILEKRNFKKSEGNNKSGLGFGTQSPFFHFITLCFFGISGLNFTYILSPRFLKGAYWISSNSSFIQYCDSRYKGPYHNYNLGYRVFITH